MQGLFPKPKMIHLMFENSFLYLVCLGTSISSYNDGQDTSDENMYLQYYMHDGMFLKK